jgi:hypothetical protein
MKLTLQQLEAHLWGAANILRGKTAGQDYKNYILSLMFYKLAESWNPPYAQLGFDPDAEAPSFLKPAVTELANSDDVG